MPRVAHTGSRTSTPLPRYSTAMRLWQPAALLVLAVAGVLVLSIRTLNGERQRVLERFGSGERSAADSALADLQNRIQDIDEDGRMMAGFVQQAGPLRADPASLAQALSPVLRALAAVVRHYRGILVLRSDGSVPVVAVDPSEPGGVDAAIVDAAREALRHPGEVAAGRLFGPHRTADGRAFWLYQRPIGQSTWIAIAVDTRRLLQESLHTSNPDRFFAVRDPGGSTWIGCGKGLSSCREIDLLANPVVARQVRDPAPRGAAWAVQELGAEMGLSKGPVFAAWARSTEPIGGDWMVLSVASARVPHQQQRSMLRQVLLVSGALVLSLLGVGLLIVRQQRNSAALAERLLHVEKVSRLEQQLIRAEKLATTGVLAAGIAHEIGTPLGIIQAKAEMLQEGTPDAESQRTAQGIVQQSERIATIIGQVLDFSRAQAVRPEPVHVAETAAATRDLMAHRLRQKSLQLEIEVEDELPPIAADPDQFQQVLVNLLMNACDASRERGVIVIRGARADAPGLVRIEVHDRGGGIAAEHLNAVFDPFYTTKKRGEGTGLGLPVVTSIARNHGADVSLTSELDRGTTVLLTWPTATAKGEQHANA